MPGLDARCVGVRYGGVVALDTVDVTVPAGTVVGLIGPNGAGKTTFIDAVTGFTKCTGTTILDGIDITAWQPHRRVRAGLSRTFQSVELFDELTVLENLSVVIPSARANDSATSAMAVLDQFGIGEIARLMPDELSHGRRRLVGLARSLMARPKVLLLDEPAAGLDSNETAELVEPLKRLAAEGLGVLLVDHDVDFVANTCSQAFALDFGKVIAAGETDAVLGSAAVHAAYLGDLDWHIERGDDR